MLLFFDVEPSEDLFDEEIGASADEDLVIDDVQVVLGHVAPRTQSPESPEPLDDVLLGELGVGLAPPDVILVQVLASLDLRTRPLSWHHKRRSPFEVSHGVISRITRR